MFSFDELQHNFLRGRSTTSNLATITQFVSLNNCFSVAWHHALDKLHRFVLCSPFFYFFKHTCLIESTMYAIGNGFNCYKLLIGCSVPQGSSLKPLFFCFTYIYKRFTGKVLVHLQCMLTIWKSSKRISNWWKGLRRKVYA